MKSGLVSSRDPYLMDPSLMVDPNLILDYASTLKDDFFYNPVDPFGDLINFNDAQLENIILGSGLSGENVNSWSNENVFDFEDLLKEIKISHVNQAERIEPKAVVVDLSEMPPTINETEVANYEEVYSSCSDEVDEDISNENTQVEAIDNSVESTLPKAATTRKRKLSDISEVSATVATAPKRRKARRSKRVQDERVKNQNKVAAMKYREKKKTEKGSLEDILQVEVDKNTKLKASMEELKVNIDVLKELLGKYLSPGQMRFKSEK